MVDKNIIQSRFTKLGVVPIDNQHYLYATLDNNLIGIIVFIKTCDKHYIHDENFAGNNGELSMWMFYNLITGANKNSYLDSFLGRSVNATEVSVGLTEALNHRDEAYSWFIG